MYTMSVPSAPAALATGGTLAVTGFREHNFAMVAAGLALIAVGAGLLGYLVWRKRRDALAAGVR